MEVSFLHILAVFKTRIRRMRTRIRLMGQTWQTQRIWWIRRTRRIRRIRRIQRIRGTRWIRPIRRIQRIRRIRRIQRMQRILVDSYFNPHLDCLGYF